MFRFIDKDIYGEIVHYTFDILNPDYDIVGKVIIVVGLGQHHAGVVFDNSQIGPEDSYEYLEDLRELLDADLIQIDEPHDRIYIAEIVYEDPKYLF